MPNRYHGPSIRNQLYRQIDSTTSNAVFRYLYGLLADVAGKGCNMRHPSLRSEIPAYSVFCHQKRLFREAGFLDDLPFVLKHVINVFWLEHSPTKPMMTYIATVFVFFCDYLRGLSESLELGFIMSLKPVTFRCKLGAF